MDQIDVWWWLGVFSLGLDQAGLEVDNVFPQRVILGLQGLEVIF
jgi:hypothetical protein